MKNALNEIFTWVSGFASLLGLFLGIYPIATLYFSGEPNLAELKIPFMSMSFSIFSLIIGIAFLNVFYGFKINKLIHVPLEVYKTEESLKNIRNLLKVQSKITHNIFHHLRYLIYSLREFNYAITVEKKRLDQVNAVNLLNSVAQFLITLADNLKIYCDKASKDDCAVTIKLITKIGSEHLIKTYIRDSASYRERKESDFIDSKHPKIYYASDNTAFNLICSADFKDTYFVSNNLKDMFDNGKYTNSNPKWQSYYNATVVLPISIVPDKEKPYKRDIAGFLCIDNRNGNLTERNLIDILGGIADMLFILFFELDETIALCQKAGVDHEQIRKYVNWDYS
jgi:hypothetical protein